MHDGDLFECVHYVSDVFDANTVLRCHCYDDESTEIGIFQEVYILKRVTKNILQTRN